MCSFLTMGFAVGMRQKHKHYRYVITIVFNALLFYLLYFWLQKNINLHTLLLDVEQTNLDSALFVIIAYFCVLGIYGFRLKLLLNTHFRKGLGIIGIGNGITIFSLFA